MQYDSSLGSVNTAWTGPRERLSARPTAAGVDAPRPTPPTITLGRAPVSRVPAALVIGLAIVFATGCPLAPQDTTPDGTDDTSKQDTWAGAMTLSLKSGVPAEQSGTILSSDEVDIYGLGTLKAGDRVYVDVRATGGSLDTVAALFDSRQYLLAFNDDRVPDGSDLDPLLDIVIPERKDAYYLGITSYPGSYTTGSYTLTVEIDRGTGWDGPEEQILFLDWDGGKGIVVQNVGVYDLNPFSATDLGLPAEDTARLKDRVQTLVEQAYSGYDLVVLNSDDNTVPQGPHSTVYFGGLDLRAFAISEQIDTFNQDPNDNAIIFTGSFDYVFDDTSLEQMAQALANTIAHEVGHLLGLVHTDDSNDLMDTTAPNERILSSQKFKTGRLDESVFPFGYQAATELLKWVLGLVGL